jgi:N-acetyl-anhydromuramyl-L-alanine amidase AmpD
MPIRSTVDHARHRVTTRCEGVVTFDDVVEHLELEARERGLSYHELFDVSGCRTNITADQIRSLVHQVRVLARSHPGFGPTAIVAHSDVMYGMARMFSILNEVPEHGVPGPPIEVFRDVAEAEQWLRMQARTGEPGG